MIFVPRLACALVWFCVSCAAAQTSTLPTPTDARPGSSAEKSPPNDAALITSSPPPVVNSPLTAEGFYELLLGELNIQANEPGTGYSLILNVARRSNNAQLYQRAVEVALKSRSGEAALQAARSWHVAQPTSRPANRALLQILLALNRLNDTAGPLKNELAMASAEERSQVISAIPGSFLQASDKKLATSIVEQAVTPYTLQPATASAAWTTLGRMRLGNDDLPGAREAAQRAQASDPAASDPAVLALALMARKQASAEQLVQRYLDKHNAPQVRLGYARALTELRRYPEALAQLRLLSQENPNLAESWLLLGTLQLQEQQPEAAEVSLNHYVKLVQAQAVTSDDGPQNLSRALAQAYLSLAQIAEDRKDYAGAEAWLARIDSAQDSVGTRSRRASILANQGKLSEARALLQTLPDKEDADARLKAVAEAQLLREHKQYQAAYDVLATAVNVRPEDADLIYEQAMMAEKTARLDEMERLLRRVIALKPDYHHAYNALGFSLADRNVRVPEARQLILKALEFAPNDPFIQDSLGWAEFRLGNKAAALRILDAAYKTKPDVEIAAHLGEVLWSTGQRAKAIDIWKEGQRIKRDNDTLVETLKRLRVPL